MANAVQSITTATAVSTTDTKQPHIRLFCVSFLCSAGGRGGKGGSFEGVTLRMLCDMRRLNMGVGESGRVVIEIDPGTKRDLYAALYRDGQTLKSWFLERADEFMKQSSHLPVSGAGQNAKADEIPSAQG